MMARAGGRTGRVLSSGRLPLRPVTCKKSYRGAVRKSSTTSVDSGYSLCSTDSEDQVLVINRGLDRCAALLHDLLQCDGKESQLKPHKGPGTKGNVRSSTMKTKKMVVRRQTTAAHVHKEKGPLRRTAAPALCNAEAQRPRVTSPPLMPSHNLDLVTTQMQRLDHVSSRATCPAPGPEASARYNCRLPTSTPTLSPQHPANLQSSSDADFHQALPPGGITHFPSSTFSMAGNIQAPALHDATVPAGYRAAPHAKVLNNYKSLIRDSDLLQCVATHLAQLQQSEPHLQNQAAAQTRESDSDRSGPPTESDEEDAAVPVRDISCQTSFTKHRKTPEKTEKKIQTVKYLLGDIKSLVVDRGDEEAQRLVTELQHRVSSLPTAVSDISLHAEIALAMQPLRSENAQLRRRLRILNQQLRDRERGARTEEQNSEVTLLQSMNEALQQQLSESQKGLESLRSEHQELLAAMEAQREESRRATQIVQEKERDKANMEKEVDEATGKMKSVQFKLEASEKENQILGITLRQRDAEVARLRDLTRTLQASMAKLLCDLGKDASKPKAGSSLTRAALGSYERQLQSEEGPASTSILNYLKRLETDQVLTGSDLIYSDRPVPQTSGQLCCGKADVSEDCRISQALIPNGGPPSAAPAAPPCYSPHKSMPQELGSDSFYLTSTEPRPDETLYLPLMRSPCKYDAPLRRMCSPPKVYSVDRGLDSSNQIRLGSSDNPGVLEDSHHTLHTSNPTSGIHQPDRRLEASAPRVPPPSHPPPVLPQTRSLQPRGDPDQGKADWSLCSFSTFTSHDEQDFRNGLAALDANIAELQRTLQSGGRR